MLSRLYATKKRNPKAQIIAFNKTHIFKYIFRCKCYLFSADSDYTSQAQLLRIWVKFCWIPLTIFFFVFLFLHFMEMLSGTPLLTAAVPLLNQTSFSENYGWTENNHHNKPLISLKIVLCLSWSVCKIHDLFYLLFYTWIPLWPYSLMFIYMLSIKI